MKASIRVKLLIMCVFLVGITISVLSVAYFVLISMQKHNDSRKHIQIAFDYILDDYRTRKESYKQSFSDPLQEEDMLRLVTIAYADDPDRIRSVHFIVSYLAIAARELNSFAQVISADRLRLYGRSGRLLAAYDRSVGKEGREIYGLFAKSSSNRDTYVEVDRAGAPVTAFLLGDPIPDRPLPAGIDDLIDVEKMDEAIAFPFSRDDKFGIRVVAPVLHNNELYGLLVGEMDYKLGTTRRYASISKTEVNFFSASSYSVGT
ncbi:MAG: hypothetical protein GY866_30910, partial [Proteobacteria bacterium]|nr:hypothetical protein [Pseudomonadota bacterium]